MVIHIGLWLFENLLNGTNLKKCKVTYELDFDVSICRITFKYWRSVV